MTSTDVNLGVGACWSPRCWGSGGRFPAGLLAVSETKGSQVHTQTLVQQKQKQNYGGE